MMGENIPGAGFGQTPAATTPGPTRTPSAAQDDGFSLWDSDGFGFGDLLDIVNPLQHLPLISTLYRDLTGDDIGPAARVLGGALFGGPIGAAVSVASAVVDEATGDDLGGHMLALARDAVGGDGDDAAPDGPVMVADAGGANPFEPADANGWVPPRNALAHAVDEGDHLLVARQIGPGTMNEPGEWEWVRIPKHAGATPREAGEPLGNPAAAAPGRPGPGVAGPAAPDGDTPAPGAPTAAPAPEPQAPAPETGAAPASGAIGAVTSAPGAGAGRGEAPDTGPTRLIRPEREGAAAPQSDAAHDPLLAEAEKLFQLGLQYEPGSEFARIPRDDRDGGNEQASGDGAAQGEAAAPANPFDPASASEPVGPWVANAMMEGLDKYRAMVDRQAMPGRPAVDVDL